MSDITNVDNRVKIDRPVYQQSAILQKFHERKSSEFDFENGTSRNLKQAISRKLKKPCIKCQPRTCLASTFPCIEWLSQYNVKQDLVKDIIAGCTVAVMNIPQGMGYALLGNVPPVTGLYMAVFPVFMYIILGTSRHCAMGSFAVITLMSGKIVTQYATYDSGPLAVNTTMAGSSGEGRPIYSATEVASAVCFLVGIFQLILYVLRLGSFSSFLSDTIINALTAGAAVHVFTSQIKDLLGMRFPSPNGNFQVIRTYITVFSNLHTINLAACVVSLITMASLIINNQIIKPWVSKRTIIPFPIELLLLAVGTCAAQFLNISEIYNLSTVGNIAVGLPAFQMPPVALFPSIAVESFVVAVVAYIISLSMAFIFAQKLNYEIDPNQELLAQGAGNLFGSFFSCLPFCASLSRSAVQESVGGRTQLTSLVCAVLLIGVLTSFAKVFEPLPRAILAGLIIVALRNLLWSVTDIFRIWKISIQNSIVFIITYLTVVIVEVDIGLMVGVILSNLLIFFRGVRPKVYALSRLPNTELYVDPERCNKVEEIDGVCIIHFSGSLNFTNQVYYKEQVYKLVGRNPKRESMEVSVLSKVSPKEMEDRNNQIHFIILDLCAVTHIDPSGASAISALAKEFLSVSTRVLLAGTSGPVYDSLKKCIDLDEHLIMLFPTIHDAVLFATNNISIHPTENSKF